MSSIIRLNRILGKLCGRLITGCSYIPVEQVVKGNGCKKFTLGLNFEKKELSRVDREECHIEGLYLKNLSRFRLSDARVSSLHDIGNGFFMFIDSKCRERVTITKNLSTGYDKQEVISTTIPPFFRYDRNSIVFADIQKIDNHRFLVVYCSNRYKEYDYEVWIVNFVRTKYSHLGEHIFPMIINELSKPWKTFFKPVGCKIHRSRILIKTGFSFNIFRKKKRRKRNKSTRFPLNSRWTYSLQKVISLRPKMKLRECSIRLFLPWKDFLHHPFDSNDFIYIIRRQNNMTIIYICRRSITEILIPGGEIGRVVNIGSSEEKHDFIKNIIRIDERNKTIVLICDKSIRYFDIRKFRWISVERTRENECSTRKSFLYDRGELVCSSNEVEDFFWSKVGDSGRRKNRSLFYAKSSRKNEGGVVELWKMLEKVKVKELRLDQEERKSFVVRSYCSCGQNNSQDEVSRMKIKYFVDESSSFFIPKCLLVV